MTLGNRSEGSLLQAATPEGLVDVDIGVPFTDAPGRYRLPVRSSHWTLHCSGAAQAQARSRRAREKSVPPKSVRLSGAGAAAVRQNSQVTAPICISRQDRTAPRIVAASVALVRCRDATHRRRGHPAGPSLPNGTVDRHPHGHGSRYRSGEAHDAA